MAGRGHSLLRKVEAAIRRHALLRRRQKVAVAVSGGPDSVALLDVLVRLAAKLDLRLSVLHVNHGVRGGESGQDARFVRRLAARYGLDFHAAKLRFAGKGKGKAEVGEDDLRRKRYEALARLAAEAGARTVALGHHRDDLAETVVMHLLRGSGPAGLGGFRPKSRMGDLTLVRPLYECSRREILDYCEREGLRWREDRTNRDVRWLRNRIRHELLPMLERRYNPRLRELLAENAVWFREDEAYFENKALELMSEAGGARRPPRAIGLESLEAAEVPVLVRLFRLWTRAILGREYPPSGRVIAALIEIVERPDHRGEVRCGEDVVFFAEDGLLKWKRAPKVAGRPSQAGGCGVSISDTGALVFPLPPDGKSLSLPGRTEVVSPDGKAVLVAEAVRVERRRRPRAFREAFERAVANRADALEQFFDADRVRGDLVVRNRRRGDRFHPFGSAGTKKLKDFLIDSKIPRRVRDGVVLVCDEEEILWVAGVRIGEKARLAPETETILKITLRIESADS